MDRTSREYHGRWDVKALRNNAAKSIDNVRIVLKMGTFRTQERGTVLQGCNTGLSRSIMV